MFVLILHYQKPLSNVERHLDGHRQFLAKYYQSQHFLLSGRQVPRVGGVILCQAESRSEIESIIQEDPFYQHGIAQYQIIEFMATLGANAFLTYLDEHTTPS